MSAKFKKFTSWIYIELITIGLALSSNFILKLDANIRWLTFFMDINITIILFFLERKIISPVQEFKSKSLMMSLNYMNYALK